MMLSRTLKSYFGRMLLCAVTLAPALLASPIAGEVSAATGTGAAQGHAAGGTSSTGQVIPADNPVFSLWTAHQATANIRTPDRQTVEPRSADLRSIDLRSADLRSVDFRSVDLRIADLPIADKSGLDLAAAVPDSLVAFAEQTVDHLSGHAPFTAWSEAELEFTPLGPGTHGWLVTLSEGGLPQGYLIITAVEDGGYSLTEYGIGSTLPFSQAPLYERLAAEGLLKGNAGLPEGSVIERGYSGVLPVWDIRLPDKKVLHISAFTGQALPVEPDDSLSKGQAASASHESALPPAQAKVKFDARQVWLPETPSLANQASDSYSNLLWVTTPGLQARSSSELRKLLEAHSSLVFSAGSRNAAYEAPFALNGWQRWHDADNGAAVIYTAVTLEGADTMRFLPASSLAGHGVFHALPRH
ncbi:hypothetical protein GNP94_09930 [Paenibacillus campinasensis]|uniref:Uncharacterized protein n=1 Tax=Paenibacillus campinasensis TaxID=66347 RepID=A0ABW9SZX5_9BACL|nr:hypothetical protein [Paenibacillus campinasensis]MUG66332.1 hypothetical protein [Paenibacillus campinasensis]